MLLRALRAHLLTSGATLVLSLVVTAGAVAVVGASRVGHTPVAVAAMLALYGGVALAEQAGRATAARLHDVALARLRGRKGGALVAFAAGPLLAVSLVGCAAGAFVGVALARRIADQWHLGYSLGAREVVTAVAILAGAWVTIAIVAAAVIRRPLADALSVHPRRRGTSLAAVFLEILVVAAAGFAVYEAHHGTHDWVPLVAPALVALAAGQVVMWLLALTPRLDSRRRIGLTLTSRRLRRDPAPASVMRIVIAATVLLAVSLTGSRAAAVWRSDAAHLRAGGPLAVPFSAGGLRAYAAAHDADPSGRWLMAAVAVDDLQPAARRVFVDARRWNAVVGDYFTGTSAGAATSHMSDLAAQVGPVLFRGSTMRIQVADVTRLASGRATHLTVRYVGDQGYPRAIRVTLRHPGTITAPVTACRLGCSFLSVRASGSPAVIHQVTVGTARLVGAPVHFPGGVDQPVATVAVQAPELMLRTPDLSDRPVVAGIDGTNSAARLVGHVRGIPFLGRSGSLLDLARDLRGSVGTVALGHAYVVARADTPEAVLTRLHHDGGGRPTSYAVVARALDATPQARSDDLVLLVALGVALVALIHLASWLAGQVASRRTEVAGLRTAGFLPATVRRAYVGESVTLALLVLVAAAAAAAGTTSLLLRPMPLTGGWSDAPAIDLSLRPWTLTAVVVAAAVMTGVACSVVFTRFGRRARPSALREDL